MDCTVRGLIPSQWLWTGYNEREKSSCKDHDAWTSRKKEVATMQPQSKVKDLCKSTFNAEEFGA